MNSTLFSKGPLDITHYIKRFVRGEWKDHHILKNWMADEAVTLGKAWDEACKLNQNPDRVAQEDRNRFEPVLRELKCAFTLDSTFLDASKVINLNPNLYLHEVCNLLPPRGLFSDSPIGLS
jgi:hypothetical protein